MNPIILAVAPDDPPRSALGDVPRRRYGGDYDIVVADMPPAGSSGWPGCERTRRR